VAEQASEWALPDSLDLAGIPRIWPEMARRIHDSPALTVSLAGVTRASSAALALLLQGLEEARNTGCRLRYRDIPDDLLALARVSNVQDLLLE